MAFAQATSFSPPGELFRTVAVNSDVLDLIVGETLAYSVKTYFQSGLSTY